MNVNILLFHEFETLDAFGPVEILGMVKENTINYYSIGGGIVVSAQGTLIVTEKIESMPMDGILVIPGGRGTRTLVNDTTFIEILKEKVLTSSYCLSICTGSALLAKTGLIDGKKATSNKKAFDWVTSVNSKVQWIRQARWVVDDIFYTSSGVSAGMDMSLGFIKDQLGEQKAMEIANHMEYIWNSDCSRDLFAP